MWSPSFLEIWNLRLTLYFGNKTGLEERAYLGLRRCVTVNTTPRRMQIPPTTI